jgi:hypothetical protein
MVVGVLFRYRRAKMEILFRLIKDGKVVGYESHSDGQIYHGKNDEDFFDIFLMQSTFKSKTWIPHDRKDLWTGLKDKNGRKIFENDKYRCFDSFIPEWGDDTGVVSWWTETCSLGLKSSGGGFLIWDAVQDIEVIGIEGVE